MAIYQFRTSNYAGNIYIWGTTRFDLIPAEYHEPVKQFAAINFTVDPYAPADNRTKQIDLALTNGWITQAERDQTVAYIVYEG